MEELVSRYFFGGNIDVSVVAARILIAVAPAIHPSIFAEESVRDKLVSFVKDSPPPLQNFATGVLAIALTERELADTIVRTGLASTLFSRLKRLLDPIRSESDDEQGFLLLRCGKGNQPWLECSVVHFGPYCGAA